MQLISFPSKPKNQFMKFIYLNKVIELETNAKSIWF